MTLQRHKSGGEVVFGYGTKSGDKIVLQAVIPWDPYTLPGSFWGVYFGGLEIVEAFH